MKPLTGLDYYVSRYYDPVAGVFLSADTKEGNAQGMNPYAYVAQNPETLTDPSGQMYGCPGCGNSGGGGGDPTPPPPPDHGPTCGPDPSSCEGGSHQPTTPKPTPRAKTVNLGGCSATCRQNDINLLEARQQAADAIEPDWFALISALGGIILDWGNPLAIIQDVVSDVPLVTKLIMDYVTASGHAIPPILKDIQLTFTMLTGVFDLLKAYSYIVWTVGAIIDPALSLAKPVIQKFLGQGITLLGTGLSTLWGLKSSNVDYSIFTNSQVQDECKAVYHIAGCQ